MAKVWPLLMWLFLLPRAFLAEIALAASKKSEALPQSDGNTVASVFPLIPHHQQVKRRLQPGSSVQEADDDLRHRDRRRLEPQQLGALYQGYGSHYVDLWCGKPPQRQTVIVGTGAGMTGFPCAGCTDCGASRHTDQYFQPMKSWSFAQLQCDECMAGQCRQDDQCHTSLSYAEGSSWSGFEARDRCYAAGPHHVPLLQDDGGTEDLDPMHASYFGFNMTFACQMHVTGLFKSQLADGILGMDTAHTTFWKQMYDAGKMEQEMFSLCFARQPTADRDGTQAGAITLGGSDERLHSHKMVFSHSQRNPYNNGFTIELRKVYLRQGGGGDSVQSSKQRRIVKLDISEKDLNGGHIIIESGTTDTYFTSALRKPFEAVWKQLVNGYSLQQYNHDIVILTKEELANLPTILFQIKADPALNQELINKADGGAVVGLVGEQLDPDHPHDVLFAIPPSHYMEYDRTRNVYVARFYMDQHPYTTNVLGANAMMGHDVLFDIKNDRIGWAESPCDYDDLVAKYGFGPHGDGNGDPSKIHVDDAAKGKDASEMDTRAGWCSSGTICRGAVWVVIVSVCVVATIFIVGRQRIIRVSGGRKYHVASDLELEMTSNSESLDDNPMGIPADNAHVDQGFAGYGLMTEEQLQQQQQHSQELPLKVDGATTM